MKKKEGFTGQRTVIIPQFILNELRNDELGSRLYMSDIGFYPCAKSHQRSRNDGCNQNIFIYCTDGEGWLSIDGKISQIKANQYFIIPNGTPHAYGSHNTNPWSIYWLHYSGDFASFFNDSSGKVKVKDTPDVALVHERVLLFEEIIQNLEMGYSQENLNYANICLWHFLASFKYASQFGQIKTMQDKDLIETSIFYMRENLSKKLSLEILAEHAGLSPSHYSMLFRQKTSRPPMDYLIHLRIQKACQLLDATKRRINDIGNQVGYEDPYYFSRIFKKVMGISPAQYRKQPKG
jgi:AraC family transcriptional regulator of arabinose operon